MERYVIIVNSWKPLTIITKRSILDLAAALDPSLVSSIMCVVHEIKRMWKITVGHRQGGPVYRLLLI